MRLIRLPNGDYVRADHVFAIRKGSPVKGHHEPIGWRVIVDYLQGSSYGGGEHANSIVLDAETEAECDSMMRDLEQEVMLAMMFQRMVDAK